jgi:hypothetical protein
LTSVQPKSEWLSECTPSSHDAVPIRAERAFYYGSRTAGRLSDRARSGMGQRRNADGRSEGEWPAKAPGPISGPIAQIEFYVES